MLSPLSGTPLRATEMEAPLPDPAEEREKVEDLLEKSRPLPFPEKLNFLISHFIGCPYGFGGPLGEGPEGDFSKKPLWRLDVMDCTTYPELVLALAHAKDFDDFCQKMNEIRYKDGVISHVTRTHFIEVDWVPNLKGYLEDVTLKIKKDAPLLEYTINKKDWYTYMASQQKNLSLTEQEVFAHLGDTIPPLPAKFPYIPKKECLKAILKKQKNLSFPLFFNVAGQPYRSVRFIGTPSGIYHQGFIISTPEGLFALHATSLEPKGVVKIPLKKYLKEMEKKENFWGLQLFQLTPPAQAS